MNFKSLALGSVLALGSIFGGVNSAEAGSCWHMEANTNGGARAEYCSVHSRVNSNGHTVIDIDSEGNGNYFSVVLWNDGYAEVIGLSPRPQVVEYYRDSDGDARLVWADGYEFAFRF